MTILYGTNPFNEDDLHGIQTPMEDDLPWKTTSHGRQPRNIKSGISQQPFIGSYSNFKLKFR